MASFGVPPAGSFNARFEGDNRLVQEAEGIIRVQSTNYPLELRLVRGPESALASGTYFYRVRAEMAKGDCRGNGPDDTHEITARLWPRNDE
jgi:hypothetical protein